MRIRDQIRDCVCYIVAFRGGVQSSIGTAFVVSKKIGFENQVTCYVVTAAHCLFDDFEGEPDDIGLVFNMRNGGAEGFMVDRNLWIVHPESDVAILHFVPDSNRFQYGAYAIESAAPRDFRESLSIGAGDDTFVTGLLVQHPGRTRILPIVRLGSIASIPSDTVRLELEGGREVDEHVILVEVKSIGGLSGSPVYLHLPFWRDAKKGILHNEEDASAASGGQSRLLGVMHGYFKVEVNDPDNVSKGEDLNTGIAVVIPIDRVLELIDSPEQVKLRDDVRTAFERRDKTAPTAVATLDNADDAGD
jgi:trypsin-like peptidase